MKSKWVATPDAIKFKPVFHFVKRFVTFLFISLLLIIYSCESNDELEIIHNESPVNQSPPQSESPTDAETVIVYTDIDPDFISENLKVYYNLDLNNDQTIDFTMGSDSYEDWRYLEIFSNPKGQNHIISITPWYSHPVPLNSGSEIFNLRGYRDGESYENWGFFTLGDCFGGEKDCFYNWENKVDRYLGLKFIINGQTHYGWACLEVISATQWVVKDYAYNATPNIPILAGQKI